MNIKNLSNIKTSIFLGIIGLMALLPRAIAFAGDCTDFKAKFAGTFDWVPDSYCSANGVGIFAIETLLTFAGVAAVLFIIVGGFWYITSAGNEETAEKGKKTLINAIIGLVLIVLAGTIVRIVANTIASGK